MLAILLTILISLLFTTLFGHVVHWALHQSFAGPVNKAHMTHHLRLYPPEDFTSEIYRDSGKDATPKFFLIAAIPLILAPIVLWWSGIIAWPIMITVLLIEGLMGFLHNYLHDSFHIENHWLSRIPLVNKLFARWVNLHYMHHVNMAKNYGIFTFLWDRLFGTFVDNREGKRLVDGS
jgi:sterol desaturase/sphingolipid hydroxylase (fatty acid hydroxylase superfamily)